MSTAFGDLALTLGAIPAVSFLIKATVALLLGLGAAQALGRARASVRHLILASTFLVLLTLPIAATLLPAVPVAVATSPGRAAIAADRPTRASAATSASAVERTSATPAAAPRVPVSMTTLVAAAWITGALVFSLPFAIAVCRLRLLRRRALPWIEGRQRIVAMNLDPAVARAMDIVVHEDLAAPITCGVLRPSIMLPADAREWPEAALRRALVHELEHVRRGDWIVHLAARAVCAIYWFHPLVWIAFRKLALEAERACDDAVVMREESTQYAGQLVTLAQRMSGKAAQPALAMAHRSDLSARVTAILDAHQRRGRAGFVRSAIVVATAIACVIALAPVKAVSAIVGTPAATGGADDAGEQRRARGGTLGRALVEAADEGDLESVRELLDAGGDVNAVVPGDGSPLIAAAREGHLALVTVLLDRGADVNLAVGGDGNPLIMAAREGHAKIVELLLDRGASVDQIVPGDENALIQASAEGRAAVVQLLLARGANPNARVWVDSAWERPDGEWRTPLNMAERGGHREVVGLLKAAGAVE